MSERDAEGDIDDSDVLTEDQIASLAVGSVIRVWEGRWDCGIIRACNVIAHRMTLLGDGEARSDDSAGIDTADISSPEPWQSEQESDGRDTAGAMTSAAEPVAVTPAVAAAFAAADADTSESGTSGSTVATSSTDHLLDLGLFASRGKLRFVDDVRPTGGTAILSVGERQRQLTQWQFGLGDLVWARLKRFPPWPAVISCNPNSCARGDEAISIGRSFSSATTHTARCLWVIWLHSTGKRSRVTATPGGSPRATQKLVN